MRLIIVISRGKFKPSCRYDTGNGPGTPTETLFTQYWKAYRFEGHRAEKFAIERAMLTCLEDARQFAPAMSVLCCSLQDFPDPDQGAPEGLLSGISLPEILPDQPRL